MCFYISKHYPKALTAEHEIECYKLLFHDYESLYHYFPYKLNKLYKTTIREEDTDIFGSIIKRGFHSYSHRFIANEKREKSDLANLLLVTCIIPKGAKYYYNPLDEEYVSNQIIIKGI
jgi:hypothetical protein